MANTLKIARSGGSTGHTATAIPTSGLEYGELGWVNGTNRLFIGRATADPTSNDGSPTPYEITRTATATKTGMAGFTSNDFSISTFNLDGTGGIVSIKKDALTGLTALDLTDANHTIFGTVAARNITMGTTASTIIIPGNLTVQGSTTSVASSNLEITDKSIQLGKGATNQAGLDGIGIYGDPTTGTDVEFFVASSGTKWNSNVNITALSFTTNGGVFTGNLTGTASSATTSAALTGAQASAITANTAKTGITSGQASAITANTAKTGITSGQASAITANTAKTGITSGQASAITANTAKTGISSAQASAITANTAKVGTENLATSRMLGNFDPGAGAEGKTKAQVLTFLNVSDGAGVGATTAQINAIAANTAKTGITSGQASAITANTAKTSNVTTNLGVTVNGTSLTVTSSDGTNASIPAASASAWGACTDEVFSAVAANTLKTGITSGQASAITANTAKTGITSGQASAITANTAKTGITSGQASAITANTAKTGISSGQASAITANTAKSTNVTTNLGVTRSGAAYTTTCSDGTNASHFLADTNNWGLMSDEMFDTLSASYGPTTTIDGGTVTWS